MTQQSNNLRNAAILVAALDDAAAERLLARLEPEQAGQLRRAAALLENVSQAERDLALRVFTNATPSPPQEPLATSSGVELDESLAVLLDQYDRSTESTENNYNDEPITDRQPQCSDDYIQQEGQFDFANHTSADVLAQVLKNEQPQTIAIVLTCLNANRAAALLHCLPQSIQAEILCRMSHLEPSDPTTVQALAKELRSWVDKHQQKALRQEQGFASVQKILAATNGNAQSGLMHQIRERNPILAKDLDAHASHSDQAEALRQTSIWTEKAEVTIQPAPSLPARQEVNEPPKSHRVQPCLEFDNLHALGNHVWSQVLAAVEPELVVLALAGADEILIERIASRLPAADAESMRRSLTSLGPTRLTDVTAARTEITRIAGHFLQQPNNLPVAA